MNIHFIDHCIEAHKLVVHGFAVMFYSSGPQKNVARVHCNACMTVETQLFIQAQDTYMNIL